MKGTTEKVLLETHNRDKTYRGRTKITKGLDICIRTIQENRWFDVEMDDR